jgi:hypothetical protein
MFVVDDVVSNPPGFGYVVFKTAEDAEQAVTQKNNVYVIIVLGRYVEV